MAAIAKSFISETEYLEIERKAEFKSEYYKGEIFATAGAAKEHNKIVAALIGELYAFLKGKGCDVFPSDLRMYNQDNGLYTYPDVTIVCGKEEYLDDKFDTLLNPTVIFEVLSPSTEDYDRETKFKLYRSISSLKNYVIISSTGYSAEVYTRVEGDKWILLTTKNNDLSITISGIDYEMVLADVYAQVDNLKG